MHQYSNRKYLIATLVILSSLLFLGRLFYMQVIDDSYKFSAESNSKREVVQFPARGLIYDRNGTLMVSNQAAYDIMINPVQLTEFDTIDFCQTLSLSKDELEIRIKKASDYNRYASSIFMKQVPADLSSVFQEKLYKFPGFFVQTRTLRKYSRNIAAHVLGYVGEVGKKKIEQDSYYKMGDYIGISGIEKTYEKILRGEKGKKYFMVDNHNRITDEWEGGRFDVPVGLGTDITLTLDADLQEYGEHLMSKFSGSVVAIEPKTGEILSLISAPSYSPDLLVGRGLSRNFQKLSSDTLNPVFNRAVAASYPPGSTFKVINALIGLQEDVISTGTQFSCYYGYYNKGIHVGCHHHESPLDLRQSIQNSCNAYYCNVLKRIMEKPEYGSTDSAFKSWRNYLLEFGFGNRLGTDVQGELKGFIPKTTYYDKYYGAGHWNYLTIISLAIGQGELGITPLQMANMTASIANRGYFYTPHLLKKVDEQEDADDLYHQKHVIDIDTANFEIAIDGMELVVNGGEGSTARIAKIKDIVVCGKTGTAQNPFGEDHSIFVAFAPREDPQIAIAVYVENVGFGSTWAAPIASLMIEKYIKGEISRAWLENHVLRGFQKKKKNEQE